MADSQKSSENIAYKTRQSLIWYTTIPFLTQLIRFANSILLARLLSPDDFGIIGLVTVILYYCDSFSDFGFGKAIIQRSEVSEDHYTGYFSFNILVSMLFFLGAQFFSDVISRFYQIYELADAIRVYAFLFLITACAAAPIVKLKRELRFKALAIIQGVKVLVSMSISLTLAVNGYQFWSIIYAMLFSQVISLILLLYVSKQYPRFSFNLTYLKDLLHFGLWDFIGAQFKLIGDSADKLIIGKSLGVESLGFYDKALGLARMPNDQISLRLSHISFSSFSRIQDNKDELDRYFRKIIILNATILLPIFVGLIWVAESFTSVLLGEKWLPMVPTLQIFAVSFIFMSLTNPIVAMNQAAAKVKRQTQVQMILTIFLVVGLLIASPYGVESAALVIMFFNILMFFGSLFLLNSYLELAWVKLFSSLAPPIFLVLCMTLTLYLSDLYGSVSGGLWGLLLSIFIGGLSYSILFILLPFKKLEFLRKRVIGRLQVLI